MRVSAPPFLRGQLVQVRSIDHVLTTLDEDGRLEGLPFMPEMASLCGQTFRVAHRVERTCVVGVGMRQMRNTVFLEQARCDGSGHDGCQRACLLFWKDDWLMPVGSDGPAHSPAPGSPAKMDGEFQLVTRKHGRYFCQSTELVHATLPTSRWNLSPFLREVANGDLTALAFLRLVLRVARQRLFKPKDQAALSGSAGKKAKGALGLVSGDWVDVKNRHAIAATLNERGANCGLGFKPTMEPAIGGRFQVLFQVRRIILEQEGTMVNLSNTVALNGVVCEGDCVHQCPRAEYLYWRESWLDRADGPGLPAQP